MLERGVPSYRARSQGRELNQSFIKDNYQAQTGEGTSSMVMEKQKRGVCIGGTLQ